MSDYKRNLFQTIAELKKAIAEKDDMHIQVLWDRLEKQVMGKSRYY